MIRALSFALAVACLLLIPAGAPRAQTLTQLPLLQSFETTQVRLQWETDSDPAGTVHEVDYGLVSVTENTLPAQTTLAVDATHFLHRATIDGLQPNTSYRYRVRSGAETSAEFGFRTAGPADQAFRMAWISDNQSGQATFRLTLAQILAHDVDFIGHAGDTVNDGANPGHWDSHWTAPLSETGFIGQEVPVLVARGNHDGESAMAYAYHWLPGNGSYHAQTIGRTRFVFLDGNLQSAEQNDWLAAELASAAAQEADFRIVVYHQCAHTNLWGNANGYHGTPWIRQTWVPLFSQHAVDLVVQGHAHAYERGELDGVMHTIVGGAGGPLDTFVPPATWPFIEVALSVHHYVIMDVTGSTLTWRAYDLAGTEIDAFALQSTTAPVPIFPHAYRTRANRHLR